ncbi:c-type cytochrome [soil metagenome]
MTPVGVPARTALGLLLTAAGLVVSGCSYFRSEPSPYRAGVVTTEAVSSGRTLYLRDCAWCHGSGAEGTQRAPDLVTGTNGPAFTHFMLSTGRMPLGSPDERTEHGDPAYDASGTQAIVDYVAGLGGTGPDIPAPDPQAGDPGEGLELYQENCAACHSTTLVGGALTAGQGPDSRSLIAPDLGPSTPQEIAEAMLVGPGAMPVFGHDVFSNEEVDSIVRYVVELQNANDRGGAPIGHVGPVAEGAVAWIVGLGALLLLIRWIGTKAGEE